MSSRAEQTTARPARNAKTTLSPRLTELAQKLETKLESLDPSSEEATDTMNALSWELGVDHPERSQELAEQALKRAHEQGYERGIAYGRRNLAYTELVGTDFDGAIHHALEALNWFEAQDDIVGIGTTTGLLGMVYTRLGDYDKALEQSLRSRTVSREAKDTIGEAWAFQNIGLVRYLIGEIDEARTNYRSSLEIFQQVNYPRGVLRLLNLLGTTYQKERNYKMAIGFYAESLAIAEKLGMLLGIAGNYSELGRCYQRVGELEKARHYFDAALEIAEQVPPVEFKAASLLNLSELEAEEGDDDRAGELLEQALALVEGTQAKRTIFRIHQALSVLRERRGESDAALRHFKEYHRLREEVFSDEGQVRMKNLEIRLGVEHAEKEAELNRQKFEALAAMQSQLIRSEKMALLGDFVAGLSHELNTPMGVIKSNSMLALRAMERIGDSLGDDLSEGLERSLRALRDSQRGTEEAAARVSELVSSLKKFARLDEAEKQEISISEILEDTLALFESRLEARIQLIRDVEELPKMPCNPGELNQVFMTLLVNAEQAIDAEGEIRVTGRAKPSQVEIEVIDTGRGISSDRLEKLFDIDFQPKDKHVRMRVGLSSALAIVQKHGGDIGVESAIGMGTRFHIRIPFFSNS